MRAGLPLIPLCALLAATGCQRFVAKPNIPQTVTVVVEKFKPLPDWATAQLPNAAPVDGTVGALWHADEQRAATLDFANCTRRLLARLDKGEKPDLKDCK
jgi:hypothetical protein